MAAVDSSDYVFWCGGTRFLYLQYLNKSSLASISWATVFISSHPGMRSTMWHVNTPSKQETLTKCIKSLLGCWSGSAYCWLRVQTDTDPLSVKCWARVPSIHSALVSTSCWHNALNQSWVNVGPPSVTLALIQRGAKHDTVTQYWANVRSAS